MKLLKSLFGNSASAAILLFIGANALAEIPGFRLSDTSDVTIRCQQNPGASAEPRKIGDAAVCTYSGVECRIESPSLQIFFDGRVSLRCPAAKNGCPLLHDCAKRKLTQKEKDAIDRSLASEDDPNLLSPGGSGIQQPWKAGP